MNDTMYPPNRPRPTGENRRARSAAQNTPRPASPAASEPESGGYGSVWLLLALAGGAALAWVRSANGQTSPAAATPAPSTTSPTPGTSTTPSSPAPTSTQLPTRPELVPPSEPLRRVFVQSFNGETIYERLRQTGLVPHGFGLPSTAITMVPNSTFIGYLTGRSFQPTPDHPRMFQIYTRLTNNFVANFWVDSEQVVVFNESDANAYIARGVGKVMTADTGAAIKSYFNARYRA